jgi:hypothetical protein
LQTGIQIDKSGRGIDRRPVEFINENGGAPGAAVAKATPKEELSSRRQILLAAI